MQEFIAELWLNLSNTGIIEWIGVLAGLAYVILAAKKHILCWLFALISSCVYVYLFFVGKLYFESFLSIFYIIMAVYGFLSWDRKDKTASKIIKWKLHWHLLNILISGVLTLVLGYLASRLTDQANPYTDAFTTVFSLAATFMVAKKALHNWLYWIIIDGVSVFLYYERGYAMSAVLMVLYTFIALFGWMAWYKIYRAQEI